MYRFGPSYSVIHSVIHSANLSSCSHLMPDAGATLEIQIWIQQSPWCWGPPKQSRQKVTGSWRRTMQRAGRLKKHLGGRISRTWWWIGRGSRERKVLRLALRTLAFWLKYLEEMCGPYWDGECPSSGGRQVGESQRAGDREQKDFLRQAGQFWVSMDTGVSWGWWRRFRRGDQDQPGSLIIKSFWNFFEFFYEKPLYKIYFQYYILQVQKRLFFKKKRYYEISVGNRYRRN